MKFAAQLAVVLLMSVIVVLSWVSVVYCSTRDIRQPGPETGLLVLLHVAAVTVIFEWLGSRIEDRIRGG